MDTVAWDSSVWIKLLTFGKLPFPQNLRLQVILWLDSCVCVWERVFMYQPNTDVAKQRQSDFINIDRTIPASRKCPSKSQKPRALIKLQSQRIYLLLREATELFYIITHLAVRECDLHPSRGFKNIRYNGFAMSWANSVCQALHIRGDVVYMISIHKSMWSHF